ncbi:MAG: LacI family DNA-binding transcriptional regulator, partial [Angelakisella sp.]
MATIKQIASLAGVSRGTVDRVLNNRGAVGAETETKIREIAAMVNYSPNRVGKTLSIRKKNLKLGFLLLGSAGSNPFIDEVLAGAGAKIRELAEYGVTVELRQSPLDDFVQQLACMEELVGLGISGLAIMPVNHPAIAAHLSALATQGMAIVTVNSDMEHTGRLAYVGSNYYKSGETAAGLMALMTGGTARVGIVTGSGSVLCHTERIKGFCDYMAAHYPAVTVAATVENHDDDFESFERTKAMLCADPGIDALYLTAGGVFGACRGVKDLG